MKKFLSLLLLVFVLANFAPANGESKSTVLFFEDTGISSIAGLNGSLYMLRDDGLFQYIPGESGDVLIDGSISSHWEAPNRVDYLLADGSELYGFHATDMTLERLVNKEGKAGREKILTLEGLGEGEWIRPRLRGGSLSFLKEEAGAALQGGKQSICRVDIATGEQTETETQGVMLFDVYKNGQYIALTQSRIQGLLKRHLVVIDAATGEQTILQELENGTSVSALTYDPVSDTLYGAARRQVYAWREGTGFVPHVSILAGDTSDFALIDKELAAVIVDNSVAVFYIDPQKAAAQEKLVLQDPIGRGEHYKTYVSAHPEVSLVFAGDASSSNEDRFVQDMVTQSDAIDIYILSDKNLLKTIYDKRYGADLSASAALGALAADMYPPFQAALMRDGAIFAFPKDVFVTMLAYNPAFFEAFGFSPPATYDELLDLSLAWLQDFASDHPEVYFQPFQNGIDLVPLLTRYADEMARNGKEIRYDKESLKSTVQKYLEAKRQYDASFGERGGTWDMHAFNLVDVLASGQYQYLPLAFEAENQPVISGSDIDFSYFVVNPYSKNTARAIAFLESYEADRIDMGKSILYKSHNTAKKAAGFDQEIERMQAGIQKMEEALAAARPEEKKEMEERLHQAQANMEMFAQTSQWSVSQEEIDKYQQFVPAIYISGLNPFTILTKDYGTMFDQLEEGNMDITRFMQEMDKKIQLLALEAQ